MKWLALYCVSLVSVCAWAGETHVETRSLPGATLSVEATYSPTKKEFEAARDARLERMRNNDYSAFQNVEGDPTVTVKTTATVGISWRGVGLESGRSYTCTYTASEDALWMFEGEQADIDDDNRFKKCSY